jgi:N-acetyl-anhydromuramyl-L-alanine amidase AmpD
MARGTNQQKTRSRVSARVSRRTRVVWTALALSMAGVGGLLVAVDHQAAPTAAGLSIPPLVATSGPESLEVVFNTVAPARAGRWQAIVIHDTGALHGTPASLETQARRLGLNGMGYHFVIGNGSGLDDGQLHVGARWLHQSSGAHSVGANADWFNRNAVGIALVGDGERRPFTPAQVRRLTQLTDALCAELGIPRDRVYLHSQVAGTTSPGRFFPEASFRAQLAAGR